MVAVSKRIYDMELELTPSMIFTGPIPASPIASRPPAANGSDYNESDYVERDYIEPSKVEVKTPEQLSQSEREAWSRLRDSNPALYSPYFHIGYTDLVAQLRDDVRIVCVYLDDKPIAFLPFQGQSFARPVGAPMTDYHGFICAPNMALDMSAILKAAAIGVYHFSALVDSGSDITVQKSDQGAVIDISMGAEEWRRAQNASYRRHYKNCGRKLKRSLRDHGEVEVKLLSQDQEVFDKMIAWKRAQFVETGLYDVLGAGWTLELLERLWKNGPEAELRCDMFVLEINGELAAIDMGLTDGRTYHSWMVTYNRDYHSYSPGIQLLERLLDHASDVGYSIIDLGVGIDGYKRSYHDMDAPVGMGFVAASGPAATLSKLYNKAEQISERAPLGKAGQLPGKLRRRYSQIAACDPSTSGRVKAMFEAVKSAPKR